MGRRSLAITAATVAWATTLPAWAAPVVATIGGGYYRLAGVEDEFDVVLDGSKGAFAVGASVRCELADALFLGARVGYARKHLAKSFRQTSPVSSTTVIVDDPSDVSLLPVLGTVGLAVHRRPGSLVYVSASAGRIRISQDTEATSFRAGWSRAFAFAGGVELGRGPIGFALEVGRLLAPEETRIPQIVTRQTFGGFELSARLTIGSRRPGGAAR
jgi:hypothetical protein